MSSAGAGPAAGDTATGPVEAAVLAELARDARVETWNAAEGKGALRLLRGGAATNGGETVVLLHGRGHAAPIWFPCWPALAAFVDPIEACLAGEIAAGRASGLALCGHSLGGLVALELALRARLPVRRLILIDSMGLGPAMTGSARVFFRLHPERLLRWLGPRLFGRLNPSPPTPLGRRVGAYELELLAAPAAVPARAAAARAFDALCPLRGPVFHRRARLGELSVPVFLLWGARDAALPPALVPAACAELRQAASLILAQGHSPHLDAPEEALPPLLDFLAAGARRG